MKALKLRKSELFRLGCFIILIGLFLGGNIIHAPSVALGIPLFGVLFLWRRNLIFLLLALLCFGLGYARWRDSQTFTHDTLIQHVDEIIKLKADIVSFPDIREKSTRVYAESDQGKFLLILPTKTNIDYGQVVQLKGKVQRPRNFGTFDYQAYLERFGVQTIIRNPKQFEILPDQKGGNPLLRGAKRIRNSLENRIEKSLPDPHNRIATGVLLGVKRELPSFLGQNFRNAGLQHVLVVSGFNVTVLVIFFSFLFRRFGRRVVFYTSLGAIIFYAGMTGADPPILRASIMGGIVGFAAVSGRFADARNLVLLSLLIISLFNPKILHSDLGLYLSTAATMGIIVGVPLLQRLFRFIPDVFAIRTLFSVAFAAQMAVAPIIGLFFQELNLIGLLSNLFSEPLIPFTMIFGIIAAVGGLFSTIIAKFIAIPAFMLIEGLMWLVHFFGRIEPLYLPKYISIMWLTLLLCFLVWTNFSRKFQSTYLEQSDIFSKS